ncbi:MAG: hypothetical protein HGA41_00265 [Syntrophaceae bacterium]|nr:hypothetical protein [Syntrophaceae bacterium]
MPGEYRLNRSPGLQEPGSVKKRVAQLDHCSIEAEKLVLERKELRASYEHRAFGQKLTDLFLIRLPRAVLIGIG